MTSKPPPPNPPGTARFRRGGLHRTLVTRILGTGLAAVAGCLVLFGVQVQHSANEQTGKDTQAVAARAAADAALLFQRWRDDLLVASANAALTDWYTYPERRAALRPRIEAALVGLHTIYPTLVDEACFIDADGTELARAVQDDIAAPKELSPDESNNAFFRPTFALSAGTVWQNPPYLSADSHRWVVSNSTPLVVAGRKVALLHFEANLDAVGARVAAGLPPGMRARIVDTATNKVMADTGSARAIIDQPLETAGAWPGSGPVHALASITGDPSNGNHWRVEVSAPRPHALTASLLLRTTGFALLAALLLALVAGRIASRISRPIHQVIDATDAVIRSGDRSLRVNVTATGEIGALGSAIDSMLDALDAQQTHLKQAQADREEQLRASYTQQREVEQQVRLRAQSMVDETAAAVVAGLQSVADQVTAVRTGASMLDDRAELTDTVARQVVEQAREADGVLTALSESLHRVAGIARLIGGVAQQTNLLALNATIEAARAGAAGRGFGVVANEVKELATATASSTAEIANTITSLERDAAAMATVIRGMTDGVSGIDDAASELRAVARDEHQAVDTLDRSITATLTAVEELTRLTERLERRAAQRAPVGAEPTAEVLVGGRRYPVLVRDLSESGLGGTLDAAVRLEVGATVDLDLVFDESERVSLPAQVIRRDPVESGGAVGLRFVRPPAAAADLLRAYVQNLLSGAL